MISIEQLYQATDEGLLIIALHYPEALTAARNGKPFRARAGERTPSAHLKKYQGKHGSVWKVTDFGGEGRAEDPIEIHMRERSLTFTEALMDLASHFGVAEELNRSVNRPDIRKQPAAADQEDGSVSWDIDQEFTESECRIMGPNVTAEHLKALNWYRVNHIVTVKNREAVYKYSNEKFPIFMRECWFETPSGEKDRFYKIYEPLNPEKQYRFQYQPKGKKPQKYVNGLAELKERWERYNDKDQKAWDADPANENKPYKEKKLPEAVICSGERDALCVRSMGYFPLWFNSETYQVSSGEMKEITRLVETVYNIPDIDSTGRAKGRQLALRYIDVHTVWLPERLSTYRDNRRKPRKDLRDWMEIYPSKGDFKKLLAVAAPAKFWITTISEKTGNTKYEIDVMCLMEFLQLNGFYILRDKHAALVPFIRVEGSVVRYVTEREIRNFVFNWAVENGLSRSIINLIYKTTYLNRGMLESLKEIDLDFSTCTQSSQLFYFQDFAVKVTGSACEKVDTSSGILGRYVFEDDIISHRIRLLPDMFRVTHPEGCYKSSDFDIEILDDRSKYFRYLINSSRIYWRKELEYGLEGVDAATAEAYRRDHKFDIAGPSLSQEEIAEQKQCLISKMFAIGYMLHRYKLMSRPWAPFAMDNVIGENDQCNGGSGKSFMFWALSHICTYLKLSGRNPKMLENNFAFKQISKYTDMVLVDDCDDRFPFKQFYDSLTSDMTINTKNVSAYQLKYSEAPKFAFTTNYVPREFNGSTVRRMLFVVASDYYHQQSEENDYLETRTINTDFGGDLMLENYPESDWEADINFFLQCVRFYLSLIGTPAKIEPKMDAIIFRKNMHDMSDNFREWAEGYFGQDEDGRGENLDRLIVREQAFEDYKKFSGASKTTMNGFTKALKAFCYVTPYIDCLNPEDLHNSGNRIIKRIQDPLSDRRISKEMIYIRTVRASEEMNARTDDSDTIPPGTNLAEYFGWK